MCSADCCCCCSRLPPVFSHRSCRPPSEESGSESRSVSRLMTRILTGDRGRLQRGLLLGLIQICITQLSEMTVSWSGSTAILGKLWAKGFAIAAFINWDTSPKVSLRGLTSAARGADGGVRLCFFRWYSPWHVGSTLMQRPTSVSAAP